MVRKSLVLAAVILDVICSIFGQTLCPRLQKPWNGQFIGDCNGNIGAECVLQCRQPFILVGSSVRVCRSDGTWSGSSASCDLQVKNEPCSNCPRCINCDRCVNCERCTNCHRCINCNGCTNCDGCVNCDKRTSNCVNLFYPENAFAEGQCGPGIVGEVCTFRCHSGYSLEGNSRLTCLEGGQWSSIPPFCRRTSDLSTPSLLLQLFQSEHLSLHMKKIVCWHADYKLKTYWHD